MIIIETIEINEKQFTKTYSDKNLIIRKIGTNEVYVEAIDILTTNYEYEETDTLIPDEPTTPEQNTKKIEELENIIDILLGGESND